MKWFKKEEPIIEFSCREWAIRKYAPVLPAHNFMPDAYKDIPTGTICPFDPFHNASLLSIKLCPALNQYQSAGYVIPAWADMEISFDDNGGYSVKVANPDYRVLAHTEEQYPGLLENRFKFRTTLKFLCPWSVKTKPGYSLMWLPMFFHDVNYQAVPAILDADILPNELPINMMFFERKTTFIKMGDPLVHIIPFKRTDITGISREYNDADQKRWKSLHGLRLLTKVSWRPFIKNKLKFTLDRKDTDLT
jgi:hypothetical protein